MDHLLKVMKVDSLSWNASELDPSLDCLAFDVRNKSLKSVPCYWELPMVCIRPELISPNKLTDTLEKRTGTFQCPTNSWHTSLLFPDKDVCYKVFTSSASSVLYKDAILSCESQGGHLAIAHDSSTLQAIQNLLGTLIRDPPNRLWIGLRKVNTQEPIMLPIQPTVGQTAASNWKVWSQIDQPNGYICEKMTTRQQDTELYIDNTGEFGLLSVGVDFKPLTSNKDRTNVSELLERSSENRIKPATKVNFQLSCFVGRDYAYQKSIQIGKSELKLPFLQISERTESYEWLGPEIRCETWDSWTPEPLRKSWIFPGDSAARPTSFVIRFRHLNVTYVSTSHDPTFVHRSELYKSTLNYFKKLFHEEFVKKYETNLSMLLEPGTDPLVFQQDNEDLTSSNLISSYRLVILVSPEVHSNVEEQAFIDLNSFLTAKFKDSNNRSDVGVAWVDIKATEFCPSHGTSDRGEFVKYITDSERLLEDPLNERPNIIIWPKARAGELITSEYPCVDSHGNLIERRCLGNRITGLFWESLEEKVIF